MRVRSVVFRAGQRRHSLGNVFADLERSRGGGGGRVADVERIIASDDVEVVDEFSVIAEGLSANAGGTGNEIFGTDLRDEPLKGANESGFRE